MLKKLRVKFIVITMIAVVLILAAIMATVNVVNYVSVIDSTDEIAEILLQNNGRFPLDNRTPNKDPVLDGNFDQIPPELPSNTESFDGPQKGDRFILPNNMSIETPFDTRYFTVTFKNGSTDYNLNQIAAINEDQAKEMAEKVLSKGREKGVYNVYRYHVKTLENGDKMVLFIDITRQMEPMRSFLEISLIVMAVCIVLFLVGIILISKPILRPIAESYTRQKRFITDAGHELKTPLTIISANNEIQEMEMGETECTQAISKQVSRMAAMVKNLTELAKMDEEETLHKKNFNLSGAFSDVASNFEKVFEKNNKNLTVVCQDGISYFGTELLIRRLFTLLLENASKYSLTYAKAELYKKGKNIHFTVINDAKDISQGDLDKCFERFYRSDEARASQTEGSGIGLSTAQEIVRLHKGKISAEGTEKQEFLVKVIL